MFSHLYFWLNRQGLLHATAVTQGWNRYQNKCQRRKVDPAEQDPPAYCQDLNPQPFNHESGAVLLGHPYSPLMRYHCNLRLFFLPQNFPAVLCANESFTKNHLSLWPLFFGDQCGVERGLPHFGSDTDCSNNNNAIIGNLQSALRYSKRFTT